MPAIKVLAGDQRIRIAKIINNTGTRGNTQFKSTSPMNPLMTNSTMSAQKLYRSMSRTASGNQGAAMYQAKNPAYGAVFTYHINDEVKGMKSKRKKNERELSKNNQDVPFPGWDALLAEGEEEMPKLWFTITDSNGNIVNRISGKYKKGIHSSQPDIIRIVS